MRYLLVFLIVVSVHAHDDCVPQGVTTFPEIEAIADRIQPMSWWSADPSKIESAFCRRGVPSEAEMEALIQHKSATKNTRKTVHGLELDKEPRNLVTILEELTTRTGVYGRGSVTDPQVNIQETYQINPGCKKVRCALDKIFGPSLARKILFLKLKYGFNASHLAFSNTRQIKEEEIDEVLHAFGDLHPSMENLGARGNQRLVPAPRPDPDRPNAAADAGIILYPAWSAAPAGNKQYMIFHEIAHNLSNINSNADTSPDWLNMSDWVKTGDVWQMGEDACKVSEYGTRTPYEDFAETVTAYRYNPQYLKGKCPQKYDFIQTKIFRGIEYLSQESCQSTIQLSNK